MCVAMPGKVLEINDDKAIVAFGQIKKEVIISLIDDLSINDYILVHAGFAINKIDRDEAEKTLELFEELAEAIKDMEGV